MIFPDFNYIAKVFNGAAGYRDVIRTEELRLPSNPVDCYQTWARYNADYFDYWKGNNRSVSGFSGECYTDFIPIDIDCDGDLEKSLKICTTFIKDVVWNYEIPKESLNVFFSGSKGFHVGIPIALFGNVKPAINLPAHIKNVVRRFGYDEFDFSIYRQNSLLRIANSLHSATNLYKIPIDTDQIENITIFDILTSAQVPRKSKSNEELQDLIPRKDLVALWKNSQVDPDKNLGRNDFLQLDFPGVKKGKRNAKAFEIAKKLRANGYKINEVKDYIMNNWNQKNEPPEKDIISLCRTVESAFSYRICDTGSIGITKHLRNDPYFASLNHPQKSVYIYLLSHLNETEKLVWDKYSCKPNQIIFSYRSVAERSQVDRQTVRTLIKKLESIGRVIVEPLKTNGWTECSRLTFLPFILTHQQTHQSPTENHVR